MRARFGIICLLLLAAAAGLTPVVVCQPSAEPTALTPHQRLARDIFAELIGINTTLNVGCTKAAEALAARFRAAGFSDKEMTLAGPAPQHMNLVIRLRGKGSLQPVLFIAHLDVVEALRKDWSVDPFTFTEQEGYFYGRGTTDMKNEVADIAANIIRLKEEKFAPKRDIILAFTEDEENGDANGVSWLLANRPELIKAEYCINPDAGGGEIKNGKHKVMEIQTGEKIYSDYSLEVKNKGGHSSLPVKENAIYRLAAALTRVSNYEFPLMFNETTRLFFERSSTNETGQTRSDMLAVSKLPADTAAANRLAAASPYYNALMRTTCVATMLSGGHAENALPQTARANINCRMHPDDTPENVMATLKAIVADSLVAVERVYLSVHAPASPLRKDVMSALEEVTGKMWPDVVVTPIMSTGATDGRLLREKGMPVYGISGMFGDVDDNRAHGRDERMGVREYFEGVDFMYKLMKELSTK